MSEANLSPVQNKGNNLERYSRYGAIACALVLTALGLKDTVTMGTVGNPLDIVFLYLFTTCMPYLLGCIALFRNKRSWFWVSAIPFVLTYILYLVLSILTFLIEPYWFSFYELGFLEPFFTLLHWVLFFIIALRARKNTSEGPAVGKAIWYLPFILFLFNYFSGFISVSENIFSFLYILLSSYWLTLPCSVVSKASCVDGQTKASSVSNFEEDGTCDMLKHILLLLFTFGIWQLVWIFRTTNALNSKAAAEHRDSTNQLLLCMFVPFYFAYWAYQTAQRVDKCAAERGLSSDITMPSLLLAIFVPIVSCIIIQDKLNAIAAAPVCNPTPQQAVAGKAYAPVPKPAPAPAPAPAAAQESDTIAALQNYKALLDSGVITQEEFDAKKKQLLGL